MNNFIATPQSYPLLAPIVLAFVTGLLMLLRNKLGNAKNLSNSDRRIRRLSRLINTLLLTSFALLALLFSMWLYLLTDYSAYIWSCLGEFRVYDAEEMMSSCSKVWGYGASSRGYAIADEVIFFTRYIPISLLLLLIVPLLSLNSRIVDSELLWRSQKWIYLVIVIAFVGIHSWLKWLGYPGFVLPPLNSV